MGTIFLAGIYGVGKSTLGERIDRETGVPFYSAGDLISELNGELYGANKFVKDKFANQDILSDAVNNKLEKNPSILLAGHFCIFDKDLNVDILPAAVFERIRLEKIILLEAPVETIYTNLSNRDSRLYSLDALNELSKTERECAKAIAEKLSIPIYIYQMKFNDSDVLAVTEIIK